MLLKMMESGGKPDKSPFAQREHLQPSHLWQVKLVQILKASAESDV